MAVVWAIVNGAEIQTETLPAANVEPGARCAGRSTGNHKPYNVPRSEMRICVPLSDRGGPGYQVAPCRPGPPP